MENRFHAFTCCTLTGEFAHLMEGGEGDITVPIPMFLIEHSRGQALFDTGLHPDCQHDPAGRLGPRLANLFRIGFKLGEELSARLEAIDRVPRAHRPDQSTRISISTMSTANALIPNATIAGAAVRMGCRHGPGNRGEAASSIRAISTSATNCA
jgi:hypothetical protein